MNLLEQIITDTKVVADIRDFDSMIAYKPKD